MFLVGLTGGIASGKSTVANIFKEKNIPVIDADVFARTIVQPGQAAWKEIQKVFGNEVFHEDGQLDREALGKIIFGDVNKRKQLNKITHPKIQRLMLWAIVKSFFEGHKFIVLDIPLLFETGTLVPYIFKIITVSCDHEIQIKRLMERNNYTEIEAKQRILSQMPLAKKCELSNFVVDNTATFDETRQQVEKIYSYFNSSRHHLRVRFYLCGCFLAFSSIIGLFLYAFYKVAFSRVYKF